MLSLDGVGGVYNDLRRRDAVQVLPQRRDGQRDEEMQRTEVRLYGLSPTNAAAEVHMDRLG